MTALLLALLVWGALAFGAVYPWAYWPLAGAAALMGAAALRKAQRPLGTDLRRLTVAFIAIAAGMVLQAVPLPRSLFLALSPATDHVLRELTLGYALQPPAWHSISIDAGSTLAVLSLFAAFALLLIGLASAGTLRVDRVISPLVLFGVAMAVLGVIQRSLTPADQSLVYGFWRSIDKGDPFGPFINRNHFAGWMIMAVALTMGFSLAVLERARRPRNATAGDWARWLVTPEASRFAFIVFAVLAMATSLVLTRSRSGLAGLLVAALVLVIAMARRASGSLKRGLVVAYGAALVGGAVLWAGLSTVVTRFSSIAIDLPTRVSAWRDTLHMILDLPWFGTGFGNYAQAMLVYQTANRSTMFAQAHNDYLQVAAEGGLLVALPALAAVIALVAGIRRRFVEGFDDAYTYWIRVGAVAALAGMAMQSTVEFSLQMPGNAVLFVFAAAVALHRPLRPSSHAHRV